MKLWLEQIKLLRKNELLQLALIHDIGKNISHYSWILRIFAELKILTSSKAKMYVDHELLGLNVLKKIDNIEDLINFYEQDLLKERHQILDKTDY